MLQKRTDYLLLTVRGIRVEQEALQAYNLSVDGFHSYFVKGVESEAEGVWVHNKCGDLLFADKKFDYLFGRSKSNKHNKDRSNQLALEMERLGIHDDSSGREVLKDHFQDSLKQDGNVLRSFENEHGKFEVRDSLLIGPSGKATSFETTYEVMHDGSRRFVTTIPKR